MPKVIISSRCAWDLVNYRGGQIRAIQERGYTVIGAAGPDGFQDRLVAAGVSFIPLPFPERSISPLADLRFMWSLYWTYRVQKPVVVHHFTSKPIIYGSIAARLARVPRIVNTVTGLGHAFSSDARTILRRIIEIQYKTAMSSAHFTFFQNEDDRKMFIDGGLVRGDKTGLVPGSGVDTDRFTPRVCATVATDRRVVFLMMGRLLKEKGAHQFVEAARIVRAVHSDARFQMLGRRDVHNPSVISLDELQSWQQTGLIEYLGEVEDVRDIVAQSDVLVLPSYYREGTPRSLLEGAAMGKPIITTDNVGCREVVDDGVNGLLVPVRNSEALAQAMICMIESPERRIEMGRVGRQKIVRQFDEGIVVERCLSAYGLGAV